MIDRVRVPDQPHHGQHRHRLAGAGLADDTEDLAEWSDSERSSTACTTPFSVRNETRGHAPRAAVGRVQARRTRGSSHAYRRSTIALATTTKKAAYITRRHDHRKVEVLERVVGQLADPVQTKDDLRQQGGAADERAEVEAEEAEERDQRHPQRVAEHHAPLRHPLCARRPDVVLAPAPRHRRAQDPRIDAGEEHDRVSHGSSRALNQPNGDCVNGI